ncbi:hypothetical protein GCM10009087_13290 [Sphingomonas oligophenolica]|uniref:IclR family transcriptional regulator C-terminal domain-containing protein n=1 Tax=Sphingomonas oligophenolica TaxID=301154 RepID=A0ABU9YBZ4_9SPHN
MTAGGPIFETRTAPGVRQYGEEVDGIVGNERIAGASSISKAFSILDLFSAERPIYTADEITAALGCSRPQGYRYIRDLCQAGFLIRSASAYRLGARAIELDYIVRQSDPLLRAAGQTMREICEESGCDVLLTSLVGDRIITIHHERGTDPTTVSYSRGRVLPRFSGAGSKAIVAALPLGQQRSFFHQFLPLESHSSLGSTWEEARIALKDIKRRGIAISEGELEPENVGIAAAIPVEASGTYSSLVLVVGAARYRTTDPTSIARLVKAAALRVADQLRAAPLPQIAIRSAG